jgi:hypothetical protein
MVNTVRRRSLSSKDVATFAVIFAAAIVALLLTRGGTLIHSLAIGLIVGSIVLLVTPVRDRNRRLPDESVLARAVRQRRARRP